MFGPRIIVSTMAVLLVACSFTTSSDGLVGEGDGARTSDASEDDRRGSAEAGALSDAEPDVPPPTTCASPATACAPAAPSGWQGPFQIYDGAPDAAPMACPSPQVTVIAAPSDPENPSAACAPCTCATTNVTCATTSMSQTFNDTSCSDTTGCVPGPVVVNSCEVVTDDCAGSVKFAAPAVVASCTPSGGGATVDPPKWRRLVLGCKAPASALQRVDCSADQVCVPQTSGPFEAKLCIMQAGDRACPAPYIAKRSVSTSHDDTRGCAACACGQPNATCTGGLVYTGPSDGCAPNNVSKAFGACFSFANLGGSKWRVEATPPPGVTCASSGGQPTGGLVPTGATTICCM